MAAPINRTPAFGVPVSATGTGKFNGAAARCAGRLGMEAANDGCGIEPQKACIGAHKASRIGGPRQGLEAASLDGFQICSADAQKLRNFSDIVTGPDTLLSQHSADPHCLLRLDLPFHH